MPAVRHPNANDIHVLVTGFEPFGQHEVNPSWLAVKVLQDKELVVPASGDHSHPRRVYFTTLQLPVVYGAVLAAAPGLHAAPPVFPTTDSDATSPSYVPAQGYDFILHVGVATRGPLRVEKCAHRSGYNYPDTIGALPPVQRGSDGQKGHGAGPRYDDMDEVLYTELDVAQLVSHLNDPKVGSARVIASIDAGHFLCDFTYFCSLAEAQKRVADDAKETPTPVLFLHCCTKDEPYSIEEITATIEEIVRWTAARLA